MSSLEVALLIVLLLQSFLFMCVQLVQASDRNFERQNLSLASATQTNRLSGIVSETIRCNDAHADKLFEILGQQNKAIEELSKGYHTTYEIGEARPCGGSV